MHGNHTKQELCNNLLKTLRMTRHGCDIKRISYLSRSEEVWVIFDNGVIKKVNVECDSGIAMIKDILKAIS